MPVSTCEETSTQNPCVLALWKLMILAKNMTIAAPQNTKYLDLIFTNKYQKLRVLANQKSVYPRQYLKSPLSQMHFERRAQDVLP